MKNQNLTYKKREIQIRKIRERAKGGKEKKRDSEDRVSKNLYSRDMAQMPRPTKAKIKHLYILLIISFFLYSNFSF